MHTSYGIFSEKLVYNQNRNREAWAALVLAETFWPKPTSRSAVGPFGCTHYYIWGVPSSCLGSRELQ